MRCDIPIRPGLCIRTGRPLLAVLTGLVLAAADARAQVATEKGRLVEAFN